MLLIFARPSGAPLGLNLTGQVLNELRRLLSKGLDFALMRGVDLGGLRIEIRIVGSRLLLRTNQRGYFRDLPAQGTDFCVLGCHGLFELVMIHALVSALHVALGSIYPVLGAHADRRDGLSGEVGEL